MDDGTPRGYVPEAKLAMERINYVNDEIKSLSNRVGRMEDKTEDIHKLAINIERLTVTLQQVVESLHEHEERLDKIEEIPASKWNDVIKYILTAILGAVMAIVLKQVGLV